MGRYQIYGSLAPRIFDEAEAGDQVARQLINWAGNELGELAKAVIRQLKFKSLEFEVVLVGSMFEGGQLLIDPMQTTIEQIAPGARLVKLTVPPVVGALLIGMRAGGMEPTPEIRENLVNSLS